MRANFMASCLFFIIAFNISIVTSLCSFYIYFFKIKVVYTSGVQNDDLIYIAK